MHLKLYDLQDTPVYFAPYNDVTQKLSKLFHHVLGFIDQNKKEPSVLSPFSIPEDATLIIYSPKYWQEIAALHTMNHCYIASELKEEIVFTPSVFFTGYTPDTLCKQAMYNYTAIQKDFWVHHFSQFRHNGNDIQTYGYAWGDPERSDDPLGDYLSIKTTLESLITPYSTVLELGTLNGKWTGYLLKAAQVICIDINTAFISWIKERYYNDLSKLSFYVTKGNELTGIHNNSVDLVFCIDTLVRVEKHFIQDYLIEIHRVLNDKGTALIHFPNSDIVGSVKRGFISLSTEEISLMCTKLFSKVTIDSHILSHGSFVRLEK